MDINGYKLVCTCDCCPEQYDVFKDGEQVGYIRYRCGFFQVDTPSCMKTNLIGEDRGGEFESAIESEWLIEAIEAIDKHLQKN